jgi:hypothetical protein
MPSQSEHGRYARVVKVVVAEPIVEPHRGHPVSGPAALKYGAPVKYVARATLEAGLGYDDDCRELDRRARVDAQIGLARPLMALSPAEAAAYLAAARAELRADAWRRARIAGAEL